MTDKKTRIEPEVLAEMVMRCVGHINPIGETNYDNISYENLKCLLNMMDIILDNIQELIPDAKSTAFSVSLIGCLAISSLAAWKDTIADSLNQRL